MLTEFEKGWLVGIMEGEGCFTIHKHSPTQWSPRMQLRMTDRDVIEKVNRMLTVYAVTSVKVEPKEGNRSEAYVTRLSGASAVRLMEDLRPYMGKRRQKRIRELLDWYSRGSDPSDAPRSSSGS